MARGAEEAASEYRQALEELKDNNKMQINLMTILADDYNSFSQEIIGVIVRQVEKVPVGQKMPVMYVMDSILKNITDSGNYKDHIERNMYKVFLHVFETGDERTRLALHKLRQTWTGIFQRSTLYKIDLAVHQIDPAWPVITPQPSSASLNVGNSGPRACAPGTVRPAMSAAPARPSVHLNPHFFQKTASSAGSTDNEKSHLTKPTCDPRLARSGGLISGRTLLPNKAVPAESWVGVDRKSSKRLSPVPVKCEAEVKVVKQEQKPLVNESGDVDERFVPLADVSSGRHLARRPEIGDRSPSNGILKRKCDKEMDMDEGKKVRIRSPPVSERVNRPTPPVIKPTNDLGSHAFITTVRPSIPQIPPIPQIAQAPAAVVPVISDPSTSALLPAAGICSSTSNVGAFTSVVTTAASFMTTVPGTSVSAGVINPDFSTVSLSQHMAQPSSTSSMLPPVASVSRPIISTDTPKLEGIPANNRIFVDGRAYEVSYINDVPVIERNSLPHRIYFTGSPRNVIIDGKAHLMAFGEEKRVLIDGEEHVLK
ncbi:hypothetical protein AB6A40_009989 [Gnathostoma spinigerum]|uniref:CID domain-containing protein n=1 Tax=Gnathostoma spinigerum TaxID=75299 RepID=A0ABD6F2J0_9BILA